MPPVLFVSPGFVESPGLPGFSVSPPLGGVITPESEIILKCLVTTKDLFPALSVAYASKVYSPSAAISSPSYEFPFNKRVIVASSSLQTTLGVTDSVNSCPSPIFVMFTCGASVSILTSANSTSLTLPA